MVSEKHLITIESIFIYFLFEVPVSIDMKFKVINIPFDSLSTRVEIIAAVSVFPGVNLTPICHDEQYETRIPALLPQLSFVLN